MNNFQLKLTKITLPKNYLIVSLIILLKRAKRAGWLIGAT